LQKGGILVVRLKDSHISKTVVFLWYMVTFRNVWRYQRGDEIDVVNQRRKDNTMAKKEQRGDEIEVVNRERDKQRSIKHYT